MTEDLQTFWVWIAAPIALLASLLVAFHLRVPQITKLTAAYRALRGSENDKDKAKENKEKRGALAPWASVVLSTVSAYGAAGAIGAATAVSLGGAGAVAWVWLFAILLAPLRMAEVLLARTAPPGKAGKVQGSLAGRLLNDRAPIVQGLGWVLLILVPLAALAFYGGTHGAAILDASDRLVPDGAMWIALGVAALALVLALLPLKHAGAVLGWIGVVAIAIVLVAAIVGLTSEPVRAFRSFGRAILDAMYGAPTARAFSGATAGEVAFAAMLHLLPPVAATGGVDGTIHAEARAATKRHASAALLGPLAYGVLATLLALSFVATGAFMRTVEDTRNVRELTAYRVGISFESISQRLERDRLFTGPLQVEGGDTGVVRIGMATERGMVGTVFAEPSEKPREETARYPEKRPMYAWWFDGDRPASVVLRIIDGRIVDLQKRGAMRAFERRPLSELDDLYVRGQMLPRGARLLSESMSRAGGSIFARIALAGVLLLGAIGAAAWGIGVARTLRAKVPDKIARWTAAIPALGLALAALGVIPYFGVLGSFAAGALAIATSIALMWRAREAGELSR